ncbi:MAG TPA: hypothetical protein VMV68_03395 [Spirochaetia bacterium]|nr:hypothetical protein [Spirochaetia bacterium]
MMPKDGPARTLAGAAGFVLLSLSLTGCFIHGLHLTQSPLLKYFVSRTGEIAYVGDDGNVYTSDQFGSASRITEDGTAAPGGAVTYGWPTWSPDGKRLLFARFLTPGPGSATTSQLYVVDLASSKIRRLFSSSTLSPFYFYWSPDSRMVAFLSSNDGGDLLDFGYVSADAADSYRSLDSGSPYYWVWSKDSRSVVSHSDFGGAGGGVLSFIPLADPSARSTPTLPLALFETPDLGPDGEPLVPLESTQGSTASTSISEVTKQGRGKAVVATSDAVLYSVSPDRTKIAFLQPDYKNGALANSLTVATISQPSRRYTIPTSSIIAYFWSPDGRRIAYFTTVAPGSRVGSQYAQSANLPRVALRILDVRTHATWLVAQFPPAQGMLNVFPYIDQYQRSETIWSPDSRYLLFTADTSRGNPGVFVAQADANIRPTLIGAGDYASWSWK